ncbi:MAG TPA: helix-turn-helix domain-containing protein [Thermoplasmata archaeon]|nr:helix-turn-helix domain-containing protein [Thermoplasmata archaeon]
MGGCTQLSADDDRAVVAVVDARVRVHHPCPYCDLSGEFPRTLLLLWCDNRRDVFVASSPDEGELRRVVRAFRASFRARTLLESGKDAVVSLAEFEWADPPSVTGIARKSGVWVLHPVVYFGGTETYRLVSPSSSRLNAFLQRVRRLGDLELLSVSTRADIGDVRDLPAAAVHFFEGLTDRQARSLVAAFEGGLFDVPARSSWDAVARNEGLSWSTFGEHLRKAQLRLLANSYSALKARSGRAETPVLLPRIGSRRPSRRAPLRGTRSTGAPDG